MGCAFARPEALTEEFLIQCEENAMGFSSQSSHLTDFILRKYSHSSKLTSSALFQSAKELSLSLSNYDGHLGITRFIQTFHKQNSFEFKKLLIYGIISGSALDPSKAELLFQAYDKKCKHLISAKQVGSMLEQLFSVSIKKAVFLITSQMRPGDSRQHLKKYLNKCAIALSYCKTEAYEYIIKKERTISKDRFIDRICSFNRGCMLSTIKIRSYTYSYYIQNRPQKPIVLPRSNYLQGSKVEVLHKLSNVYGVPNINMELSRDDDGGSTNLNSCSSLMGSGNSENRALHGSFIEGCSFEEKGKTKSLTDVAKCIY